MMRSGSRHALDALRKQEDAVFEGRVSAQTLSGIAAELYAVADLLVAQPRLRRTLGDASTSAEARTGLAEQLLSGRVGKPALGLVTAAVGQRWSSPWDLTDALEGGGDEALFAAAQKDGKLDRVEDELFRFERILQVEGELAGLLDEFTVAPARRAALLDSVLGDKVTPITLELLHHAVASQRKRGIALAIDALLEASAARQNRSVARVISAVPLTEAQQERLTAALTDMYDRPISVRTAIDPLVRGGLVVHVGDEVIDGSIATRFVEARAAIAG